MRTTPPDARKHHNPKAARRLVEATGLTYPQVAARLGCSVRSLERWLSDADPRLMPYPEQYTLEALVREVGKAKAKHHKPLVREPPSPSPTPPVRRPHPLAARLLAKDRDDE